MSEYLTTAEICRRLILNHQRVSVLARKLGWTWRWAGDGPVRGKEYLAADVEAATKDDRNRWIDSRKRPPEA